MAIQFKTILKITGTVIGSAAFGGPIGAYFGNVSGDVVGELMEKSAENIGGIFSDWTSDYVKEMMKKDVAPDKNLQLALRLSFKQALDQEYSDLCKKIGVKAPFMEKPELPDEKLHSGLCRHMC